MKDIVKREQKENIFFFFLFNVKNLQKPLVFVV